MKGYPRAKQLVEVVSQFWDAHGYGPTVREIGDAMGLQSSSTVQVHINRAVENGWLIQGPNTMARTLRLPASQTVRRWHLEQCQQQVRDLQAALASALTENTRLKNGSG